MASVFLCDICKSARSDKDKGKLVLTTKAYSVRNADPGWPAGTYDRPPVRYETDVEEKFDICTSCIAKLRCEIESPNIAAIEGPKKEKTTRCICIAGSNCDPTCIYCANVPTADLCPQLGP